jgi:hypothetical protein
MKINDASMSDMLSMFDNPNVQQAAVEFVGLLRNKNIYRMDDVAERVMHHLPYSEVHFMGAWTDEPSFVFMVTALKMIELGYLPSIKNSKDF